MTTWPRSSASSEPSSYSRCRRDDPLGLGILLAAASEVVFAVLHRSGATAAGVREVGASQEVLAATLLASAGHPSWRAPTLATASLHHFVQASSARRGRRRLWRFSPVVDAVWAAALGGLFCKARRAERWDT